MVIDDRLRPVIVQSYLYRVSINLITTLFIMTSSTGEVQESAASANQFGDALVFVIVMI